MPLEPLPRMVNCTDTRRTVGKFHEDKNKFLISPTDSERPRMRTIICGCSESVGKNRGFEYDGVVKNYFYRRDAEGQRRREEKLLAMEFRESQPSFIHPSPLCASASLR